MVTGSGEPASTLGDRVVNLPLTLREPDRHPEGEEPGWLDLDRC